MTEEQSTSSSPAPRRTRQGRRKGEFLAQLRRTADLTAARSAIGASRSRVLRWLAYDEDFQRRFDDALDHFESRLDARLVELGWKNDPKAFQQFARFRVLEQSRIAELRDLDSGGLREQFEEEESDRIERAKEKKREQKLALKRRRYAEQRRARLARQRDTHSVIAGQRSGESSAIVGLQPGEASANVGQQPGNGRVSRDSAVRGEPVESTSGGPTLREMFPEMPP